ncbi:hypothetical protein GCM10025768_23560 [Microbacterium pseudoresistens]|uniref:Uncharacterized protein n=1 Tax=Microbacterium pseudoresistens TaxID=640634 RepID=A0A7Y9ETN4_9MICO|nr:hypothetical protein [Microbacterium pseudoresistens]NYD53651.1 hypothetical protein [Microbacterium pseudoresistens]
MSVLIRVRDGAATIIPAEASDDDATAPFAVALVEARGALLRWDVLSDETHPDAVVWDAAAARDVLEEFYGVEVAEAVAGPTAATIPVTPGSGTTSSGTARTLAMLTWARAWWPAGAAVPALDPAILDAEIALATAAVEHLLDDDEAVERALADAAGAEHALRRVPALAAEAAQLSEMLAALAEDYGVDLDADTTGPVAAAPREEWALAAGGHAPSAGIELGGGTAAVAWRDVPAQTVAADVDARWALRQKGALYLHVCVTAAPGDGDTALRARFGPAALGIDVTLQREGAGFHATAEVPDEVVSLPAAERTLWVRDPRLVDEPGPAEDSRLRGGIVALALARLAHPNTLAERAAVGR